MDTKKMITLKALKDILLKNEYVHMHIMLPDGSFVPPHFHVTEIGKVKKDFVDCGGTPREVTSCLLQILVADDVDHRLTSTKLKTIFDHANKLFCSEDIIVEMEYKQEFVSQFPIADIEITPSGLLYVLGKKHTACLAPDKCGIGKCC
jgi:hypothetical protein